MSDRDSIDKLIQAGNFKGASEVLERARRAKALSPLALARFYRRLGRFEEGIQLLRSEIFQGNDLRPSAPDPIRIEYANHLVFLGFSSEAAFHLRKVSNPRGYAYEFSRGLGFSTQGDFENAALAFASASKDARADDYEKLVARANLLNSYLGCFAYEKVIQLGQELSRELDPLRHVNLTHWRATCVAQAHAYLKDRSGFEKEIAAFRSLKADRPYHLNQIRFHPFGQLLIGKLSSSAKAQALRELDAYQPLARTWREWETFRDLRIQAAYFRRDTRELINAYFGSPSVFQKKRILRWLKALGEALPSEASLVDCSTVHHSESSEKPWGTSILNIRLGHGSLKPEKLPIKVLNALLQDRYRPARTHELHERLWGDSQFFHPTHSPARVHQVINRLKGHLKREKLPINVFSSHDFYGVTLGNSLQIKTSAHSPGNASSDHFIPRYREIFSDQWTTVTEMASKFEMTPRSVQLKLKTHASDFEILRDGNLRYYRIHPR